MSGLVDEEAGDGAGTGEPSSDGDES